MDRYFERLATIGLTRRERAVNHQRDYFNRRLPESLSYKEVELNGIPTNIIIDKGTKPYYKKYRSLISTNPDYIKPRVGDYIKWANTMWLVINADSDDELYVDGELYQCNYLLKWQDSKGKIIERWVHVGNASAYNTGKYYYDEVTLASNQMMIYIPIDDDTYYLKRDMRVYCDYTKKGVRYKIARVDAVSMTHGEVDTIGKNGIEYIILTEDVEHHASDNDELQICDYFEPDNIDKPESDDETEKIISSIDYTSDFIKIGSPRKFTAYFVNNNGDEKDIVAQWYIDSEYDIESNIEGNSITLSCSDVDAIGSKIILRIINSNMESSLDILVKG